MLVSNQCQSKQFEREQRFLSVGQNYFERARLVQLTFHCLMFALVYAATQVAARGRTP